jgi:predicted Zn-ribbon and HTH transcriptional regulator
MTIRQQMIKILAAGHWSARELSQALHISEKEVCGHLYHVRRLLKTAFCIEPAQCLNCGYVFEHRQQVKGPSRCPKCRSEHIHDPLYYTIPKE